MSICGFSKVIVEMRRKAGQAVERTNKGQNLALLAPPPRCKTERFSGPAEKNGPDRISSKI